MTYTTSDLFVSYIYGSEIGNIWTTREEAEVENVTNNDTWERISGKLNPNSIKRPYKVLSLYDALDYVKDYVKDQIELDRYNSEPMEY